MRRCTELVEVVRRDDRPAQFRWRTRWYGVHAVLAHWVEAGGWWRSVSAVALWGADADGGPRPPRPRTAADDLVLGPLPLSPKWGQRAWGEPAPDVGVAVALATVADGERELWRVEAAASGCSAGVFDLCFDWSTGGWAVTRVLD